MDKNGEGLKLEAKVRLYEGESAGKARVLAFADLVIAGAFVIKGIRVVALKEGERAGEPFVGYPSRRGSRASAEKYFDVAHPITREARETAGALILEEYQKARLGVQ